jgi:hypothetical protein
VLLAAGCAAKTGWERTDRRSCTAGEAPRLCVLTSPDRAAVVRVGGEELVPGECAASPRVRGGPVRVAIEDGRSGKTQKKWVRVRRGSTARVAIADDGRPQVQKRERCSGQVASDMSAATE